MEFFVGIMLAVQLKNQKSIYNRVKYKTITRIIIIIICIALQTIIRQTFHLHFGNMHPLGIITNNLILPLFGIGLLYNGLLVENTIVSKILSSRLFVLLGKSSYI
jgi:peptidoglycan/LPS O-acetylase OafA/YrhL